MKKIKRILKNIPFKFKRFLKHLKAKNRGLPSFLIIGAQKSGTTSLYSYLAKHPNIIPALKKEVHYFDLNFTKSLHWYKSFFPLLKDLGINKITGEASPQYMFYPGAIERIKASIPEIKIIMILRNPITRAYSHYNHQVRMRREGLTFEEAIRNEPKRLFSYHSENSNEKKINKKNFIKYSYLERGKYFSQLQNVLNYFNKDQILILQSEKFNKNPQEEYNKVLKFLNLPPHKMDFTKKYNAHKYPPIKEETKQKLGEFFKPHNEKLFDLIGKRFDW